MKITKEHLRKAAKHGFIQATAIAGVILLVGNFLAGLGGSLLLISLSFITVTYLFIKGSTE